jgi:1-phosphatidylinositol phosphodiesterase
MTLDLSNWMSMVDGSKKLSEFSIPGTHDSGARAPDATGDTRARLTTQKHTIGQQLTDGIRFLDIRVGYKNGAFALYHEDVPLLLTFEDVLDTCKDFLDDHPRETIIMSVKEEDDAPRGGNGGKSFQTRFDEYAASAPFYLQSAIPALGDARGKIVLFRRFALDSGTAPGNYGINAYNDFPKDATGPIPPSGPPKLIIQDLFDQTTHTRVDKWTAVENLLNEASAPRSNMNVLYVNFTSAAGVLHNDVDDDFPDAIARDINPDLATYFTTHTQGRFGIVVMDFEKASLSRLVVRTNTLSDAGFWIVDANASVTARGTASIEPPSGPAASSAIAIAATPDGTGYYLLALNGKVYAYGNAQNVGEGVPSDTQAISIAVKPFFTRPRGHGYWILGTNGRVLPYGATRYGQPSANVQAVSIVATPDGRGYWILALNGRVYEYGNVAHFGDRRDDGKQAVAMAATPDGGGYWILTTNGAVRAFGNAVQINDRVSDSATPRAMGATRDGRGYWVLTTDGNVYNFGSAQNIGRATSRAAMVGIAVDLFPGP